MKAYYVRRLVYILPLLLSINVFTFLLFFVVNTPDDMAAMHLGQRYLSQEAIEDWKKAHGYDNPLFFNEQAPYLGSVTQTLFYEKSVDLFLGRLGKSDAGQDIAEQLKTRLGPSLAIAIPSLILGLMVHIGVALWVVFFKNTFFYKTMSVMSIFLLSISPLFYIIAGQYFFAVYLKWVPISGYAPGSFMIRFLILPVLMSVLSGLGSGLRWYKAIFLEESSKEYVRTARAKGLSEYHIFSRHVLANGLIPIVTGVVVLIPLLFLGSLLMESFFSIPGLGSYTMDAIAGQDFSIVRAIVFLGSVLYLIGLLLTDMVYSWLDPRIHLD